MWAHTSRGIRVNNGGETSEQAEGRVAGTGCERSTSQLLASSREKYESSLRIYTLKAHPKGCTSSSNAALPKTLKITPSPED